MLNFRKAAFASCVSIFCATCSSAPNHQPDATSKSGSVQTSNFLADFSEEEVARLRAHGKPRGRAPANWPSFDWAQKRQVLFEFYGPSEAEMQLIREAVPQHSPVVPRKRRRLLVFYRCQYPHAFIATANYAYEQLSKSTSAFEVVLSDEPQDIREATLTGFDAVLLNNTTDFDKTIGPEGQADLLKFVENGKGLIGVHAAADSCKKWPEGSRLLNGVFRCHPWLPKGTWAFQLDTSQHPINRVFAGSGFWLRDEVYIYRDGSHQPGQSYPLISLDLSKKQNHDSPNLHDELRKLTAAAPRRPVAWLHRFGQGRVFYSNLGHNNTTYWHPQVLQHFLAGIQYALGDLDAPDAKASDSSATPALAPEQP